MEKEIVEGKLGDVGAYDVEFKEGALALKVGVKTTLGAELELVAKVTVDTLIDVIKAKIPGTIDDTFLDIVKAALKA